jgi:lysophospholipase L1-like esterase
VKRILCYGDSNTWGSTPGTGERYPHEVRWTGVLSSELGPGHRVIEEGLPGRTTVWDDPIEGHKNGLTYLPPCLASHRPLDLVVLMLGTNDLKQRFSLSAFDIAQGAAVLARVVLRSDVGRGGRPPRLLLMAPPPLTTVPVYTELFAGGEAKSLGFAPRFAEVADDLGCDLLDTGTLIASSKVDGVHFEADAHRTLGLAITARAKELLAD